MRAFLFFSFFFFSCVHAKREIMVPGVPSGDHGNCFILWRKLRQIDTKDAATDWCSAIGAVQSKQVGFVYVRRRSGLIWFEVADYKINALVWYLFESCLQRFIMIRSESLQSIIGDRAVETSEGQFIGNDGVRIWLEKMDCLLEITST